jgi:glyoxylase-like metal-dependent hydrolase (beta-lactamase superfamily II)
MRFTAVFRQSLALAGLMAGSLATPTALAQADFSKVEIKSVELAPGLYSLFGSGGNMALVTGADGTILVDDQFAPLAPKIRAAIALLTDRPVRFVINTHWHLDHTGGNEAFGSNGGIIVAHENTLKRMSTRQLIDFYNVETQPSPRAALPVITFSQDLQLHLSGQDIEALHVKNAHTDTDVLLFFKPANVIHMGDLFTNGTYPFIDMGSGGSIDGMIASCAIVLTRSDEQTQIIPGHGPMAKRADLQPWCAMLTTVRDRVVSAIRAGQTLQQVLAAKPTAEFDERFSRGAMNAGVWVQRVYTDLQRTNTAGKRARR